MKVKMYYLTRSFSPYQKGGGPLMRAGAVEYLRSLGWDIIVIMPNYDDEVFRVDGNIWQIPFKRKNIPRLAALFQRVGFYEDYLDKWLDVAFEYLKEKIQPNDIVFATSGGELGMVKLGFLLKEKIGCRFVVNFRDPLSYGYMNGFKTGAKLHVDRKKVHKKYIRNSDLILTSSLYYRDVLKRQFTEFSDIIHNNYFGYVKNVNLVQYKKKPSNKLRIAYSGIMSAAQKPEMLYEAYKKLNIDDIELYFLGDISSYKALRNINDDNVHFINFLPHDKFLQFMCENIDVGFVSLVNDYYGACVPSKIYEYINLGLPILGALPEGDGKKIINDNKYGIAVGYGDVNALKEALIKVLDRGFIEEVRTKIMTDRDDWDMESKIKEVDALLKKVISS
jgi:glycosyltransferase involved in cell wall biosynthesis